MTTPNIADSICGHEGFEARPYWDPIGKCWTFGHGLTYITEAESRRIVEQRAHEILLDLLGEYPWLHSAPDTLTAVMVEMQYQLGDYGIDKFVGFLAAAKAGDWDLAADEMLDSVWARQTPKRALDLSERVQALASK